MSKKIVSVILTVLLMLSITGATVMAKNTPDVFSVIDNLTTTENLLTVRNLTHRPDPGKLFLSGKNLMGIVTFELKKENVDSVSFLAQIHEDKEYKINLYASNRNDKWADAPLIECVTQFEYNEGTYDYYTYTTKSLPEDTKFIKIEIPAIPESYTDVQLHEISYTYNDGLNIKDNDVFFAGEVNLTATTNDLVTELSFFNAGTELCSATKEEGVWKGTWNAEDGLYNVYAVATYSDESKKYTDSVKVSVISDYVIADTRGEEELLKGAVDWTTYNYSTDGYYFCASKEKATASANFTDEGIYEIALRIRMMNAATKSTIMLLNEASSPVASPFIIQMGQPYKYIANDGSEKAFDDSVICVDNYKAWHDVRLVIDTVNMTEDVYVDNTLIGTSVNIDANVELSGIHAIKIKPENGSAKNTTVFKNLTVSQYKENYNNPEIYANNQKISDMRNVLCIADTLTFDCASWVDTNVIKCNDIEVNATYNADSKLATVILPELASDTAYSVTINEEKLIDFKTAKSEVEISSFTCTDISDENIVAGSKVSGTATLINDTGKFEDFNFFLALYNGLRLEKLEKLDEYTDAKDAQKNILAEITLPENFSKEDYELKFIVLDNMTNLKPLK